MRVAIVGSGPAGFYAAGHLLKAKDVEVEVDMIDRLPTPWGLVRGGVAPDHPNIKAVSRMYEKTAALPGFRFFGNVDVGRDIAREDLLRHFHAVVYAVGAQTDRRLRIPGEDLPGSHAATEFVAWYNAHPDYCDCEFNLDVERVAVIGNGNVAMDVARMLVLGHDELSLTDTADHALAALEHSSVREVILFGRRGPAQAAFTNPELLEMGELRDADVVIDPADLELDPHSAKFMEDADITHRRNVEILSEFAERGTTGKEKRVAFRFLSSPVEIVGESKVEGIVVERNELDENLRARPTGERETIPVGMVLRSIGYRGVALPGVPFDESRGVIPNDGGRVLDAGAPLPGEYVTGWIKRGPSGVIGTNKKDANETVDRILEDASAGRLHEPSEPDAAAFADLLAERRPEHITYSGWEAIDAVERAAGEPAGRPRVKIPRLEQLLEAAEGLKQR